jgi:2-dehydropantoate 2-reductase
MTRVCVVGAGAIGGLLGTRLAAAGVPVSALARGRTLAALRSSGWRANDTTAPVAAAEDDPAALGPHDVVVIAVKAHALPALAPRLAPLLGSGTVVVPALNGVPWWFFDGLGGPYDGMRLDAVDPGGVVSAALPAWLVLGCVVHMSVDVPEPGLSNHRAGDGLIVGEPAGGGGARLDLVAGLLAEAGFAVTASPRIQTDIWYKLWGNMTMNPISMLTGATGDLMLDDPLLVGFVESAMNEAAAIGARIGCPITQSPRDRNAVTRKLGNVKTSMLQDAEAGRPVELDALVSVVRDIGAAVGVPTPTIDALLGVSRVAARVRGLYP